MKQIGLHARRGETQGGEVLCLLVMGEMVRPTKLQLRGVLFPGIPRESLFLLEIKQKMLHIQEWLHKRDLGDVVFILVVGI